MKFMKKTLSLLLVTSLFILVLGSCSTSTDDSKSVKIGYVNWSDGIAITNLVAVILEDRLGYDVEMTMGDVGPIYASVASGDYDVFLDAWLPTTHESYVDKFEGEFDVYSTIYEGTRNGLVVPSYVDIDSIEDLNDNVDLFDGKIVGIDSGAGIMGQAEDAIETYGLDYELQVGSGPVMTAALSDAISSEEALVVTGWQPHWMFAKWDLKFLDDPEGVFGDSEYIKSVTRTGFEDDFPEFAEFLQNFSLTSDQLSGLMSAINDSDDDADVTARAWAEENSDTVDGWVEGIE